MAAHRPDNCIGACTHISTSAFPLSEILDITTSRICNIPVTSLAICWGFFEANFPGFTFSSDGKSAQRGLIGHLRKPSDHGSDTWSSNSGEQSYALFRLCLSMYIFLYLSSTHLDLIVIVKVQETGGIIIKRRRNATAPIT